MLAVLAACGGGTVIVDYAIQAQIAVRDETGRPGEAGTVSTVPSVVSPFPAVSYAARDFEWSFGTGTLGLGGDITNRSPSELCFRFDEAQVRSNLHPEPMALSVYSFASFRGKWELLGSTDPRKWHLFTPPRFCLASAEKAHVSLAPHLAPLFPTEKMFNVAWLDDQPQLTDKGVGNWIALSLPVEAGARREVLDVKLTATDSRARISNY